MIFLRNLSDLLRDSRSIVLIFIKLEGTTLGFSLLGDVARDTPLIACGLSSL